jgi:hypothetical protein
VETGSRLENASNQARRPVSTDSKPARLPQWVRKQTGSSLFPGRQLYWDMRRCRRGYGAFKRGVSPEGFEYQKEFFCEHGCDLAG